MDKHQLVTITITTAVTVVVREAINWLFAWAKIRATSETTKAKAKQYSTPTIGKLFGTFAAYHLESGSS